jgi:hypothetical protein
MNESRDNFAADLEAYLDGMLPQERRAEFERRLASDGDSLRAQIDQQQTVDAALRRAFAPPAVGSPVFERVFRRVEEQVSAGQPQATPFRQSDNGQTYALHSASTPTRPLIRWRRTLALAAAIALVLIGGALLWTWLNPRLPYLPSNVVDSRPNPNAPRAMPLDEVYRKQIANGFKVAWVCKDQEEFASYYSSRLGQPMVTTDPPPGVQLLGLTYTGGLSELTIAMLAKVNDREVLVLADRADAHAKSGHPLLKDAESGLFVHQRRIGELAFYEVSPLDTPHVLDLFRQPSK